MATKDTVELNPQKPPGPESVACFRHLEHKIKNEIRRSRNSTWKNTPAMWLTEEFPEDALLGFTFEPKAEGLKEGDDGYGGDLVAIRFASPPYGHIVFGKVRVKTLVLDKTLGDHDDNKYGYIFVRVNDAPGHGAENATFHSLFTYEGKDEEGHQNGVYRAIQTNSTPLEWFDE